MLSSYLLYTPLSLYWRSRLKDLEERPLSDLISKYGPIRRFQLLELVSNKGKNLVYTDIIDVYLRILCSYGNCTTNNTGNSYKAIETKKEIFYSIGISFYNLLYFPTSTYFTIVSKMLSKKGLQGTSFFGTKLIFLPIDIPTGSPAGHAALLVILLYQKIISVYNSWRPKFYSCSIYIIRCVCRFLVYYLGKLFVESK
jgi:hypothetical protein